MAIGIGKPASGEPQKDMAIPALLKELNTAISLLSEASKALLKRIAGISRSPNLQQECSPQVVHSEGSLVAGDLRAMLTKIVLLREELEDQINRLEF